MRSKTKAEAVKPTAAAIERGSDHDQSIAKQSAIRIICPILLFLLLDQLYLNNHQLAHEPNPNVALLGRPAPLLKYADFRDRYPRNENVRAEAEESSSRQLMFIDNLLELGLHNLRFVLGFESYLVKQSYFSADKTTSERLDTLSQLDELNLDEIWSKVANFTGDRPVSGFNAPAPSPDVEISNKFSRWLQREIKGQSHFEIPHFPLDAQPDPEKITHIDADLRACTDDIQDQKDCGACYAFSWNSFAQWHYCKQSGEQIDFSEQHIVDCGHVAGLGGCVSGLILDVRAFVHTFGFVLEKDYPYRSKRQACRKQTGDVPVKTVDFKRIVVDRREWEEVLKEQPILVEVHLPADILSYNRGIHPGHNCDKYIAHGMLLVGYGRQAGVPYWLLKNSMGKAWGENGYLRISREGDATNRCLHTGFVSKFKYQQLEEDKFYAFYDSLSFEPTIQPERK